MTSGLNLSLWRRGPIASGGGIPASVTHFVTAANMTFDGSDVFTGVNDQVASDDSYVVIVDSGATGNTTQGINIGTTTAYDIRLDGLGLTGTNSHIAFIWEWNGVADTAAIIGAYGPVDPSSYWGAAQPSSSSSHTSGIRATLNGVFRFNGVDSANTINRGQVWTAAGFGASGVNTGAFQNVYALNGSIYPFQYDTGGFVSEVWLRAWAAFTDWSEADAVVAALQA